MSDTTRLQALKDLREKVDAGGDVYGFGAVGTPLLRLYAESAFNGSLDAAKSLHKAVLPQAFYFNLDSAGRACVYTDDLESAFVGENENPARAWLLAILSALIAEEEAR